MAENKEKRYVSDNARLMAEWNWDKNNELGLYPEQLSCGSNKKVWWIDKYGHEWQATVKNRFKGSGCPYCSGKKVLFGFNDLYTQNPMLASEWHPTKNNEISPKTVTLNSAKNAWWIGKCGHEWQAVIANRNAGSSCPYCSNQQVLKGFNDLATTHPHLIKEWDWEKNNKNEVYPDQLTHGNNKKVWWICNHCNTSWSATLNSRVRGAGCPSCALERRKSSQNKFFINKNGSLEKTNPELLSEWNYKRNVSISPDSIVAGSQKKVWWICKKNHEWEAPPSSRANGIGCPYCARETQISFPEKAIFYYLSKIYDDIIENYKPKWLNGKELDIFIPSIAVAVEYDGEHWHNSLVKDTQKNEICEIFGVHLIRIREPNCPQISGDSIILENTGYDALSNAIVTLLQKLGVTTPVNVKQDEINIHNIIEYSEKKKSLATLFPKIASEWNVDRNGKLLPSEVSAFSKKNVWWKGNCGHEWQAQISQRTTLMYSCPYCSGKRVLKGFNDILTTHPEQTQEWDYEKNIINPTTISKGSHKKAWWKCSKCGHSYQTIIKNRLLNNLGCPICRKKETTIRTIKRAANNENSILVKNPELATEWNESLNEGITAGDVAPFSNAKFWWTCPKGHNYKASPLDRSYGSGCPYCSGRKHRKIRCIETGEIFDKYADAETKLQIKKGSISRYFRNRQKTVYGLSFEFID